VIRPDLHARFLAVVARGLARADREQAEHLARLRASVAFDIGADRARASRVMRQVLTPKRRELVEDD
jgi:Spy/CpxP family protein refolding chaperone